MGRGIGDVYAVEVEELAVPEPVIHDAIIWAIETCVDGVWLPHEGSLYVSLYRAVKNMGWWQAQRDDLRLRVKRYEPR